uniref:Uncharacterized protein n=1 Tax=Glossina brevipalpis TaxID=37001 RepID=A0A1A9WH90_9MUSC
MCQIPYEVQIQSALYRFIPDSHSFNDCTDKPELANFSKFMDNSELAIYYGNEELYINGSVVIVEDLKSDDRLMFYGELKKLILKTWLPTRFPVVILDFCKAMMDVNSLVYKYWTQNVLEEDRQCPENGVRYRLEPFFTKLEWDSFVNMEGRYKVVCNPIHEARN